ncbi:CPS_HP_G0138530.mRNA.1.CDS.1 [Saccharomyces cerevisiae]|nr:CPS_HP_G0047560.mRNA.1.CDS.1 [Saccharomyces cerevisiae]CAI5029682.1 CPS_HP_G0101070.mRNA.1.CDS.1 [Saccharomyces cerevisiae]CAI5136819.1 CPS_HP_G0138530.mRNA.1.CDS.1 [Saccharomyces cerevisiae]CAI6697397.1 CPS_HP_G0047560.mRNA.1.CDS.1 [Saccharomyces cerevisiae]CAI6947130.1 CPS_HP_G0101070.mRNA.1.CDS.1 [Saccharomyces cerevisiae]
MAAACICQPNLLEINVSDGPLDMIRKKRKIQQPQLRPPLRENKRQPHFSVRKVNQSYIISLHKEITCQLIAEIVKQKLSRIWEKVYIPSYELISDKDGNQIYVEQSVDENRLTSEIVEKLDPNNIDIEAIEILFDDYHLELSRLTNGIIISSANDHFYREFSFNNIIDDNFKICGTSMSADSFDKIYGVMWIEVPFNGNGLQNDSAVNRVSTSHNQIEELNDIEQEIRAFNISRSNQESIIKKEVSRRLNGR